MQNKTQSKILSGYASKILSIKGKGILRENRIRFALKVSKDAN